MLNNLFFFENAAVYEIMWKNIVTVRQVKDDNMVNAHCMLDTEVDKRSLIICNTSCLSTTTMVERTRLNVPLHYIAYLVMNCV